MVPIKSGMAFFIFLLIISCSKKEDWEFPKTDKDNGGLFLPNGFGAVVVVDSIGPTRHLAVNHNGDIYVKLRIPTGDKGNIALRDTNGDGIFSLSFNSIIYNIIVGKLPIWDYS